MIDNEYRGSRKYTKEIVMNEVKATTKIFRGILSLKMFMKLSFHISACCDCYLGCCSWRRMTYRICVQDRKAAHTDENPIEPWVYRACLDLSTMSVRLLVEVVADTPRVESLDVCKAMRALAIEFLLRSSVHSRCPATRLIKGSGLPPNV